MGYTQQDPGPGAPYEDVRIERISEADVPAGAPVVDAEIVTEDQRW